MFHGRAPLPPFRLFGVLCVPACRESLAAFYKDKMGPGTGPGSHRGTDGQQSSQVDPAGRAKGEESKSPI